MHFLINIKPHSWFNVNKKNAHTVTYIHYRFPSSCCSKWSHYPTTKAVKTRGEFVSPELLNMPDCDRVLISGIKVWLSGQDNGQVRIKQVDSCILLLHNPQPPTRPSPDPHHCQRNRVSFVLQGLAMAGFKPRPHH